jgi:hypothetical protein
MGGSTRQLPRVIRQSLLNDSSVKLQTSQSWERKHCASPYTKRSLCYNILFYYFIICRNYYVPVAQIAYVNLRCSLRFHQTYVNGEWARGSVIDRGSMLQAGKSRVQFPVRMWEPSMGTGHMLRTSVADPKQQ